MNLQSDLQQKYPLSPRKFWKKIISNMVGYAILSLLLGGFSGILIGIVMNNGNITENYMVFVYALLGSFAVFLILMFVYSLYVKAYIKRYYYSGEENFITIKKGVFAPGEIHVQWQKIQDVYVDQDILDRLMGLYDVHIASATTTSGVEAHIDGLDHAAAEGLKKFLLDKISNGSQGNTSSQPLNAPHSATQTQPSKINLTEDISSNTYPLSNKWTAVTLFSRILGSFVFPGFLILIFFGKAKDFLFVDNWVYILLGWLALGLLTMITRIISLFLWKKNYSFTFTPEHIYYKEGVISISEKHMPYSSIQDVTVKQGVLDRFFGLAKVVIENAAQQQVQVGRRGNQVQFAGIIIQGISLDDANKITNVLKTTVLGRNTAAYGL